MEIYGQIYLITNIVSGKIYIGQTISSLTKRFRDHYHYAIRKRKQNDSVFCKAIRKYGRENFKIECICMSLDKDALNEAEIILIKDYKCQDRNIGYNIQHGGQLSSTGRKASEETRRKLSESHKGYKHTEEQKRKISLASKGRVHSPEIVEIIRQKNIGQKRSKEFCDRMSKCFTGRKNPKNSENRKGKRLPFCQVWKMGAFRKGSSHHRSKPIVQLDDNKNEIKTFVSRTEAARELNIKHEGNLSTAALYGKRKCANYYWKYK